VTRPSSGAPAALSPAGGTQLADPSVYTQGVPHAEFARLRREAPVSWVSEPLLRRHIDGRSTLSRGSGFWAVTSYRAVTEVLRSPNRFSSAAKGAFLVDPVSPQDLERNRQLLINMDDPAHAHLRQFVMASFTPRAVQRMRQSVATHAAAVVEAARGRDFDIVRDIAAELPLLVLTDLLGIPRADRKLLLDWSNNLVGFDDPQFGGGDVGRFRETFVQAYRYVIELAEERRRRPADDLLSALLTREVDGRHLSDLQLCQLWVLLVVAGNETTRNLISGALEILLERPPQLRRVVADGDAVPAAAEEALRWVTPIMQFRRTATEDTVLDGQVISAGDKVVVYFISANRDESVFDRGDEFEVSRSPNPHLAFGTGPHFCLGAHLARLEAAATLDALRPYLQRLELTGPVTRLASNFMNGTKSMPARFN
jgi:cytochrome P450